jgi:signal transduction histidine kinase
MRRRYAAPSSRTVVVAFAAVAISFLVATTLSELSDVEIRHAARDITSNAAPSITYLEAFRSEVRRQVVLADDYIDEVVARAGRAAAKRGAAHDVTTAATAARRGSSLARRDAIAASQRRLAAQWRAYRGLPRFPNEAALSQLADDIGERFSADIRRALRDADGGRFDAALDALEQRVKPDADALDDATAKLVELDAGYATRLGARIDRLGRQSIRLALALDGLSVLLTVLTALLLLRVLRRYSALVERRAEELELFASRVAHDILSPLGSASLALSYIEQKCEVLDPRARRMLELGQSGIRHTRIIADDLLEFASAGARPDVNARADLVRVVTTVIDEARPLADEREIALAVEELAAGRVLCSPGILASLVSNLVRNAIKYVGDGPGRRVTVRARNLAAFVRVEVEDNGPGLPLSMGRSVFEPYVRGPDNQQVGIGLGLATVKRIIDAHDGRIEVRSVAGSGCRFTFEMPREPDGEGPAAPAHRPVENALPSLGNPPRVETEDDRRRGVIREDSHPPGRAC